MHRIEGTNHVNNRFTDGPPGTYFTAPWGNAVQEEICTVIEDAGIVLKTAATESTYEQLKDAIQSMIDAAQEGAIPAGTKMLIYADVAPTGWTIDDALDDKLAFITKGSAAGGQTGGGAHSSGSWTISGLTKDAHTHTLNPINLDDDGGTNTDADGSRIGFLGGAAGGQLRDDGGGAADSPTVLGKTEADDTGAQSNDTISSSGAWRPAAYCFIICSKNVY